MEVPWKPDVSGTVQEIAKSRWSSLLSLPVSWVSSQYACHTMGSVRLERVGLGLVPGCCVDRGMDSSVCGGLGMGCQYV
jgi:hypothetical protein